MRAAYYARAAALRSVAGPDVGITRDVRRDLSDPAQDLKGKQAADPTTIDCRRALRSGVFSLGARVQGPSLPSHENVPEGRGPRGLLEFGAPDANRLEGFQAEQGVDIGQLTGLLQVQFL